MSAETLTQRTLEAHDNILSTGELYLNYHPQGAVGAEKAAYSNMLAADVATIENLSPSTDEQESLIEDALYVQRLKLRRSVEIEVATSPIPLPIIEGMSGEETFKELVDVVADVLVKAHGERNLQVTSPETKASRFSKTLSSLSEQAINGSNRFIQRTKVAAVAGTVAIRELFGKAKTV